MNISDYRKCAQRNHNGFRSGLTKVIYTQIFVHIYNHNCIQIPESFGARRLDKNKERHVHIM